jgi:hypothetical protein
MGGEARGRFLGLGGADMGGLKKREDCQAKTKVMALGSCVDCGEPCYLYQEYVVKDETCAGAGMGALGWLHIECLEKRLGAFYPGVTLDGKVQKKGGNRSPKPDQCLPASSPQVRVIRGRRISLGSLSTSQAENCGKGLPLLRAGQARALRCV